MKIIRFWGCDIRKACTASTVQVDSNTSVCPWLRSQFQIMQGCVGVKWNQRISTSQALQPTSQVRRGTCLDLDRTSHSRRCTAVCWPLRRAATLSQALQCLQNLHPKPLQLSGEPSLKNTTSFGIFLKFENEGATKHHHHHRTLVHIQPYTFSYRNALLRPQKNAQKSPIRDNTEKAWVLIFGPEKPN